MIETNALNEARQMRTELSRFLERHLGDPTEGWPRRRNGHARGSSARVTSRDRLNVLIVGELALELIVRVETTCERLRQALRSRSDDRLRWRMSRTRLGGFAAYAGQAVASLGHRVALCTTVPAPLPACFERLFDEAAIDTRFVTARPGSCAAVIHACCRDGEVAIRRPRVPWLHEPELPEAAVGEFDVVLVEASSCDIHSAVLRAIHQSLHANGKPLRVGLRVDDRWNGQVLALGRDPRVWTFARADDWQRFVGLCSGLRCDADEPSAVGNAGARYGVRRLVLQRGALGAVLLNGVLKPHRVPTCPMSYNGHRGAGATLAATTTLSSALGADDRTSLQRGVDAATAQVAGLELPVDLAELDAA